MKERWDLNRRAVRLLCHLDRKYFLCTLFSSLTTAIAPYIPIYFSAKIIDALTAGAGGKTLALYAALTVGLAALVGLAGALLKMHADVGEAELDRLVDWKHAEKAMDLPYALIEDRKTALLRERIEMETQTGYNVYYYAVTAGGLVRYAVQIAAAVLLTFSLFRPGLLSAGAKLALLAGIVLTAVVSVLTGRRYGRLRSEFFAGCVDDNIRGEKLYDYTSNDSSGKDIRLYGMRAALLQKERDFNENFCRRERTMNFGVAWMGLLSNFVTYALQFGVYLLLIAAALRGGLSVGSIARYVSSIMLLLAGVSGLARTIRISVTNEEYMKRYLDYFDIPNPMYQGSLSVEKRDDDRYEVEFRDVSFRYPNTEAYALRHVSMKFRIGEKLAVVGRNGSGKTTFIKLLCRLYDSTEGEILLKHIEPAMNLIRQGENQLLETNTLNGGQLRIGASDTICRYYLLHYLKEFHRLYPGVHIKVTNQTSIACAKLLESGQVDFAITNYPNSGLSSSHHVRVIREFHDVFVANEEYSDLRGKTAKA